MDMFIPKYEPKEWKFGFEVEMLFGDLGLNRYKQYTGVDDAFDQAPKRYCQDVAERLSLITGEKWTGRNESPNRTGFYVVPEYDLDPITFPRAAVGGVELITPPLPLLEAEEIRTEIAKAVVFEGGFVEPNIYMDFGWHVNADPGVNHSRDLFAPYALSSFWEGMSELDVLMSSGRYQGRSAKPQHHAYGPRLLSVMNNSDFPVQTQELHSFLDAHSGQTKHFATNLGKLLDRGYLELRHFGLAEFMECGDDEDNPYRIANLFDTILRSFTISPSCSRPFDDRLIQRFQVVSGWLEENVDQCSLESRESSLFPGPQGTILFKGEELATVLWRGVAEVNMSHEFPKDDWGKQHLSIINGIDADDIMSGVGILALDAVYARRSDCLLPLSNSAFSDELDELQRRLTEADLFPSQKLLNMFD